MVPAALPLDAALRSEALGSGRARYHRRVRKLIKLVVIALGIRAFLRWRKSRKEAAARTASPKPDAGDDPADELRRKLAESREEAVAEAPAETPAPVADRRAEVHGQGRATLDEMKSTDES